MKNLKIIKLIISISIPLIVGMISSAFAKNGMTSYAYMDKPPLSPPAIVFPIAWTILYILMGLSTYLIWTKEAEGSQKIFVCILYLIQLFMNFMWSIIFFNFEMYLFAFIWLIIMWAIVIYMTLRFYVIDKTAAFLLLPYIAWLTFAAYLNLGSYVLKIMK